MSPIRCYMDTSLDTQDTLGIALFKEILLFAWQKYPALPALQTDSVSRAANYPRFDLLNMEGYPRISYENQQGHDWPCVSAEISERGARWRWWPREAEF